MVADGGDAGSDPDSGVEDGGTDAGTDAGFDAGPTPFENCMDIWDGVCNSANTDCVNAAQAIDTSCVSACYTQQNPPANSCLQACASTLSNSIDGCSSMQDWCGGDAGIYEADGGSYAGAPLVQCGQFLPDAGPSTACGECLGQWNATCQVTANDGFIFAGTQAADCAAALDAGSQSFQQLPPACQTIELADTVATGFVAKCSGVPGQQCNNPTGECFDAGMAACSSVCSL
jgi:hypothetical protein